MRKKLLRSTTHLRHDLQGRGDREISRQCESVAIADESLKPRVECQAEELHFLHPFNEETFSAIKEVGFQCDQWLSRAEIPLTFGSEPTFIDKNNENDPAWQVNALSKQKRKIAFTLALNLKKKWAKKGLLIYEQGKWCQGETTPRWSLNIYWRKDNKPLFDQNEYLALENHQKSYNIYNAKKLAEQLIKKLHSQCHPIPIYSHKKNVRKGFLLPVFFDSTHHKWTSDKSLVMQKTKLIFQESSDFAPSLYYGEYERELIDKTIRIELVKGKICIVLPKLLILDPYLDLINKIEDSAVELNYAVLLQGFGPPENPLIKKLSVTPDPGVLEVNCPPVKSFKECRNLYQALFSQTKKCGLVPYKTTAEGFLQYTGGGHHITIGGPDKDHNPFLKKTHLLPSLMVYWQHHPALSYLFSGQYIGSTCQAPRLDEGRIDNIDELTIALNILKKSKSPMNLEEMHNILKHFLVDITGNAHRSEFCLDKFFNGLMNGRTLGLVELRAFEMQGHYQTNLLMILLVISLVTRFWNEPFDTPLVRFGMRLQDEFMLPHFIWKDLERILIDLKNHSLAFDLQWFKSFFEMKFKHFGTIYYQDFWIELRQALEFHPVLGEETLSGLNSRTIDPALDRIQIKFGNFNPEQYILLCNGCEVPLTKIKSEKEQVENQSQEWIAGIRYKKIAPFYTAHPNIPIQTPLKFECLDKNTKKVILCFTFDPNALSENLEKISENKELNPKEKLIERKKSLFEFQKENCTIPFYEKINQENGLIYTLDLRKFI